MKGRIVQVGLMGGGTVPVNVGALMGRRATWIGTMLRARPIEEKIAVTRRFATEMLPLFDSGQLRPGHRQSLPVRSDRRRPPAHGRQRERRQDHDRRQLATTSNVAGVVAGGAVGVGGGLRRRSGSRRSCRWRGPEWCSCPASASSRGPIVAMHRW